MLGAKSSGVIEGAFFGHSNGDINGIRLRHAFVKLNWTKTELLAGAGAGFKTLVPRLQTDSGYVTTQSVSSFMAEFHTKLKLPGITFKAMAHYGQNSYDTLMISSFAVTRIDPLNDMRSYTPISAMSSWIEIHSNNPVWQPGIFAGYTRNLGASEEIIPSMMDGTCGNIGSIWRVSPRLVYNVKKFRVALELEYTAASFGYITDLGEVGNSEEVSNFRTLLGVYYFF